MKDVEVSRELFNEFTYHIKWREYTCFHFSHMFYQTEIGRGKGLGFNMKTTLHYTLRTDGKVLVLKEEK